MLPFKVYSLRFTVYSSTASKLFYSFVFILCLLVPDLNAQELFPHTEPASNIPKGALGVRISNELYKEVNVWRSMQMYKFMFGITNKLMLTQNFVFSNHHGAKLPDGFIKNDGNIGTHTHGSQKGKTYPYAFENLSLNLKYRFLSKDKEHFHFRMAAFAEFAGGNSAHDEAEPSLMGDNGGAGGGIVATLLQKKFALSITSGAIFPHKYIQSDTADIEIKYGNAYHYSLSMGYLLLPFKYKNYNQTNLNLYVEFLGKSFDGANISVDGKNILIAYAPALEKNNYVEVYPAVQLIIKSSLRIDLSMGFSLMNRSYVRTYPVYYLGVQKYFYF